MVCLKVFAETFYQIGRMVLLPYSMQMVQETHEQSYPEVPRGCCGL